MVSHSLFADDTLIFCEAHPEQICYVRLMLLCLEAVLGLRVNLGKSEIGAVATILGCRVAALPMKYLGLPLGVSYKATIMWNGVTEQVERRMAGRLTLIN